MEIKIDLPFQRLLDVIHSLSPTQKEKVRQELNKPTSNKLISKEKEAFLQRLLDGPVYSEADIAIIEGNRKSIAEWRK